MAGIVISGLAFGKRSAFDEISHDRAGTCDREQAWLDLLSPGSIRVVSILQFPLFQNRPWHSHSFEATVLDENCIF